jgi:hypothetical protein
MKNHIAEDLPARKFAPAAGGAAPLADRNDKKQNSGKTPEERAQQAVYDIRYKARRDEIPVITAYSEYMQNSSMSGEERNMVKAKLFGKVSGGMKAEDFNPIFKNAASDNVAKALFKVFVEKKEINIEEIEKELKEYYSWVNKRGERIFNVRITDKKTGRSYTRHVDRQKLNKLQANPNIWVEMSEYKKEYEKERTKGALTARVAAGKGLDPDGDGKVESDAKEYRGVVHNAIQRKKGGVPDGKDTSSVREDFIHEAGPKKKSNRFDIRKISNKVTISPTQGGNEKVGIVAHNELEGELISETGYSKFLKQVKEEMDCGSDDKKKKGEEEDPRSMKTKVNLVKNKLRAMGLKMSYEPEGEVIDERRREEKGTPRKPRDPAFEFVAKSMGSNRLGVKPRGVKKVPGQKPPVAGEYGAPESPAQKLEKRRTSPTDRTPRAGESD